MLCSELPNGGGCHPGVRRPRTARALELGLAKADPPSRLSFPLVENDPELGRDAPSGRLTVHESDEIEYGALPVGAPETLHR